MNYKRNSYSLTVYLFVVNTSAALHLQLQNIKEANEACKTANDAFGNAYSVGPHFPLLTHGAKET